MSVLKSGRYDFTVSEIMRKDRDGNPLKTKNGNTYIKVKLSVIDNDSELHNIYDVVFNKERVEQIVNSIGKDELKKQAKNKDFRVEDLVGESGRCLTKIRKGKDGYNDQPAVDVYLKPETNKVYVPSDIEAQQQSFSVQGDDFDDVPF
jgi:hypothetical protein